MGHEFRIILLLRNRLSATQYWTPRWWMIMTILHVISFSLLQTQHKVIIICRTQNYNRNSVSSIFQILVTSVLVIQFGWSKTRMLEKICRLPINHYLVILRSTINSVKPWTWSGRSWFNRNQVVSINKKITCAFINLFGIR